MSVDNNTKLEVTKKIPRRPSLMINALSNWAALAVNVVVAFFLTPYLIDNLGKNDYGIWALLGSIVGMYGLLDLGVGSAIMRYISYYLGRKDYDSLNGIFNSSFVLFCGIGCVCAILTFVLVRPLADFFTVAESNFDNFQHSLWFLGLATVVSFPGTVMRTAVLAHERFVPCNITRMITELLRPCLCIAAIRLGYGLQGVAFATLLIASLSLFFHIVLYTLFCHHLTWKPSLANWFSTGQLIVYGLPAAVTILAEVFRNKLDNVIIAKWLDTSWVTIYVVGVFLNNFLRRCVVAVSGVIDPRFSSLCAKNDYEAIRKLYLRALAISTSLTLSIAVTIILVGKSFILLWVGPGYGSSYTILVILILGQICAASQMPTISLVFALNKHKFCAMIAFFEGILNVGLSILFVRSLGIVGVAVGTLIPMVLSNVVILPWYARKLLGIPPCHLYKVIGRPFVFLAPVGGFAIYVFRSSSLTWYQTIIVACVSIISLLIMANWLGLSRKHRFFG